MRRDTEWRASESGLALTTPLGRETAREGCSAAALRGHGVERGGEGGLGGGGRYQSILGYVEAAAAAGAVASPDVMSGASRPGSREHGSPVRARRRSCERVAYIAIPDGADASYHVTNSVSLAAAL